MSSDNVISREPSSKISPASAGTPWITVAAPLPNLRLGFTKAFQRQGAVFSKNKNSNFPSLEKCRAGKTRELFKTRRSSSPRNFLRSTKWACAIFLPSRQRMLRNQFQGQLVIVLIQPRTHASIIKGFDRARKDDIISPCFSQRF